MWLRIFEPTIRHGAGGVVRVRGEVVGIDSAPPGDDPGEADVVVVGGTAYLRLRGRSPIRPTSRRGPRDAASSRGRGPHNRHRFRYEIIMSIIGRRGGADFLPLPALVRSLTRHNRVSLPRTLHPGGPSMAGDLISIDRYDVNMEQVTFVDFGTPEDDRVIFHFTTGADRVVRGPEATAMHSRAAAKAPPVAGAAPAAEAAPTAGAGTSDAATATTTAPRPWPRPRPDRACPPRRAGHPRRRGPAQPRSAADDSDAAISGPGPLSPGLSVRGGPFSRNPLRRLQPTPGFPP